MTYDLSKCGYNTCTRIKLRSKVRQFKRYGGNSWADTTDYIIFPANAVVNSVGLCKPRA